MSAPQWGAHQARLYKTLEFLAEHPDLIPMVDSRWMMFKSFLRGYGVDPDAPANHYVGIVYMEMLKYWGKIVLRKATNSYTAAQWAALTDNIIHEICAHMVSGLDDDVRLELGLPTSIPWDRPNLIASEDDEDEDEDEGEEDDDETVG